MNKARVLLVQPNMNPPGGGQCVSAWAVQALQDEYQLAVLTWTPLVVPEINRFYGTALDTHKIKQHAFPAWLRTLVALDPDPWSYQRLAIMMRYVKWTRHMYDLVLSLCDEVEFGTPTWQYIHFPYMGRLYENEKNAAQRSRWRALQIRLRPWRVISGFSFERMLQNISLANSDWTQAHFTRAYGVPAQTLYPPVMWNLSDIPWAERENGFVCIGRISGEKRYEDIIAILAAVRARGHSIHLHMIGALREPRIDLSYYQRVVSLVAENSAWVTLHENISRAQLERLVGQHRYGIHAMQDEHFGIAPAEMVRAGCIVFVYNNGGQVEIVGNQERLRYCSNEDAVEKISAVLEDERAQNELRAALGKRADLFSPERFMRELQSILSANAGTVQQTPDARIKPANAG